MTARELLNPRVLAKHLKNFLAAFLFYSGVVALYVALTYRRKGVVLMYHRVLPLQQAAHSFSSQAIVVTPATFERHMRFLRRHCNPVDPQQFLSMMSGKQPWLPRTCLVTFDDGWADNVEHALPILVRHKVPALVFLATQYIETEECFWQERLARQLFEAWNTREAASALFAELHASALLSQPESVVRESIRQLITDAKQLSAEARALLADRIERHLREHPAAGKFGSADRFMSWAQAASLLKSGIVTLGSHAHSHRPLTTLAATEVQEEIRQAHEHISARLGVSPTTFAFPNGDHTVAIAEEVRRAGYALAFTTIIGTVRPGDDLVTLRRVNIAERGTTSIPGFVCRLLGWF